VSAGGAEEERRTPAATGSGAVGQPELTAQQLTFYRAIADRDSDLAGWYLGALAALANRSNSERLVQAAHSVRELMEKLHRIVDTPVKADSANSLGSVFRVMSDAWIRAKDRSRCFDEQIGWSGEIDNPARAGFEAVEDAIRWKRDNRPPQRDYAEAMTRALDVAVRPLPESVEDPFVSAWVKLSNQFVAWAHHKTIESEEEFLGALYRLERLIIDKLRPETFTDMKTIEALVKEAEGR
jgi:hypothetical protein